MGFVGRNQGDAFILNEITRVYSVHEESEGQAVQGAVRSRGTGPGAHCLCRGPAMSYPPWTLRTPWSYTWETGVLLERCAGAFMAVVMRH